MTATAGLTTPVKFRVLQGGRIPTRATEGSTGLDLYVRDNHPQTIIRDDGDRTLVPCGFTIELPEHLGAWVVPRSGLAYKYGVSVANSPGTIDQDYQGEVCVIVQNRSPVPFVIDPGMRIAQMIILPVWMGHIIDATGEPVEEHTTRGAGGFGSTGV